MHHVQLFWEHKIYFRYSNFLLCGWLYPAPPSTAGVMNISLEWRFEITSWISDMPELCMNSFLQVWFFIVPWICIARHIAALAESITFHNESVHPLLEVSAHLHLLCDASQCFIKSQMYTDNVILWELYPKLSMPIKFSWWCHHFAKPSWPQHPLLWWPLVEI